MPKILNDRVLTPRVLLRINMHDTCLRVIRLDGAQAYIRIRLIRPKLMKINVFSNAWFLKPFQGRHGMEVQYHLHLLYVTRRNNNYLLPSIIHTKDYRFIENLSMRDVCCRAIHSRRALRGKKSRKAFTAYKSMRSRYYMVLR